MSFPGALWLGGGLLVAALELMAPGFFLIWVGLAALGTGIVTELTGIGFVWQFGCFALLALALIGLVGWRLRGRPVLDVVNAPGAGVVGQTCRALAFEGGEGRVSLGDGTWSARMSVAAAPPAGTRLRVVGIEGTTLIVTTDT